MLSFTGISNCRSIYVWNFGGDFLKQILLSFFFFFHSPVQIYFCLFGKSHGQGKAQSLGKKHMSNIDHAHVTHPNVI